MNIEQLSKYAFSVITGKTTEDFILFQSDDPDEVERWLRENTCKSVEPLTIYCAE